MNENCHKMAKNSMLIFLVKGNTSYYKDFKKHSKAYADSLFGSPAENILSNILGISIFNVKITCKVYK